MVGFKPKKYSLFALFIVACHFLKAQNNENFLKSMIRESFKLSVPLQEEELLKTPEKSENQDSTKINQNLKKKLLLYSSAYYMYDGSDLIKDFDEFLKKNPQLKVAEGLTKGYTNYEPKPEGSTPVLVDGHWVPSSSVNAGGGGGGFSLSDLIEYLKSLTPKEKKKRKALKIITETVYPTE